MQDAAVATAARVLQLLPQPQLRHQQMGRRCGSCISGTNNASISHHITSKSRSSSFSNSSSSSTRQQQRQQE
jgi:hypothetical protein